MLKVIIEEAWMDIVEECIEHKRPMALLEVAVNVARTMDFMYKSEDAFTLSFSRPQEHYSFNIYQLRVSLLIQH